MATKRKQGAIATLQPLGSGVDSQGQFHIIAGEDPSGPAGTNVIGPAKIKKGRTTSFSGEGMQVTMFREPGVTAKGLLERPFRFQCPPQDEFRVSMAFDHPEYATLARQTFSRASSQQLKVISFSTLFLDTELSPWARDGTQYWPFAVVAASDGGTSTGLPDPQDAGQELQKLHDSGTAFNLVVGNPALWNEADVDMLVTFRSLSIVEKAGEIESRYFEMSFSEWVEADLQRKKKGKGSRRKTSPKVPANATVKADGSVTDPHNKLDFPAGASMRDLAQAYYGSSTQWRRIAQASGMPNVPPGEPISNYVAQQGGVGVKLLIPAKQQPTFVPK